MRIDETSFAAEKGDSVTLPCDFKIGRYSHRYNYRWYDKSNRIIYNSNPASGPTDSSNGKYTATADRDLIISDLDENDNVGTFHCELTVNSPGGRDDSNVGIDKHLEVYGKWSVVHGTVFRFLVVIIFI